MIHDLSAIVLRSSIVYLSIVFFIRLFGKKELSQLSIIDFVFILLISNAVQNAMVGNDTSLSGGLIAAITLFLINSLLRLLIYKFKKVELFIEGKPVILIYKGKIVDEHLHQVKITLEELHATVREHGVEKIIEVDLAVLEVDGNISVLSNNFEHQTSKKRKHQKVLSSNQ